MARAEGSGAARAIQYRARALLETERYSEALQCCTEALARGEDDLQLRLIAAHALLAQDRVEGARKEAELVVRLDPSQPEAHRLLTDIHCERDDIELAQEHVKRVIALDPDDTTARELLDALTVVTGLPDHDSPPETADEEDTDTEKTDTAEYAAEAEADDDKPQEETPEPWLARHRGIRVASVQGYLERTAAGSPPAFAALTDDASPQAPATPLPETSQPPIPWIPYAPALSAYSPQAR